jgi:hypothetical protein
MDTRSSFFTGVNYQSGRLRWHANLTEGEIDVVVDLFMCFNIIWKPTLTLYFTTKSDFRTGSW